MPLLQRLSKRVGCRIWDAIKAKLKEVKGEEKVDKTLVDYVFVLFDPANSPEKLQEKLRDFLGDKTDSFVDWFVKVISQVDNQVAKVTQDGASAKGEDQNEPGTSSEGRKESSVEKDSEHRRTDAEVGSKSTERRKIRTRRSTSKEETHESEQQRAMQKKDVSEQPRKADRSSVASRMLSKAARDAVNSVQATGSSSANHRRKSKESPTISTSKDSKSERRREEEEKRAKEVKEEERDDMEDEEEQNDESNDGIEDNAVQSSERSENVKHEEPQRTETTQSKKRPLEETQPVTQQTRQILTVSSSSGERDTKKIAVAPPVVTEPVVPKEEDPDEVPGLLVVMPSHDKDHLNRIVVNGQLGYSIPSFTSRPQPGMMPPRPSRAVRPFAPHPQMGHHQMMHMNPMAAPFVPRPPTLDPYQSSMNPYGTEEQMVEFPLQPPMKKPRPNMPPGQADGGAGGPTSAVLCRYLPKCMKKAGVCPFLHPPCRNGRFCRYGATCVYDHSAPPAGTPGAAPITGAAPTEAKNAVEIHTKPELCRYHPYCTKPKCPYLHKQKVMCSFGAQCRQGAQRCGFIHPEDLAPAGEDDDSMIPDYDEGSESMNADQKMEA